MYKDVSQRFVGTGMDAETFQLLAADSPNDHRFHAYTPEAIHGFYFAAGSFKLKGFDGALHDMCHAIDFWQRNQRERLLQPNFGFVASDDTTDAGVATEIRVLTLQAFMALKLFGNRSIVHLHDDVRTALRSGATPDNQYRSNQEWFKAAHASMSKHESNGIASYIGLWNDLCQYVKANR
jgi:hypothetical protein